MKITRDVVTDLLPLYESGDASPDTRALVEAYFRSDPDFERLAKAALSASPAIARSTEVVPSALEREAVRRTRRALRIRSWIMGVALFFTLLPFSFGEIGGKSFLMMRDVPQSKYAFVVAAVLWLAYARQSRKLSPSGW